MTCDDVSCYIHDQVKSGSKFQYTYYIPITIQLPSWVFPVAENHPNPTPKDTRRGLMTPWEATRTFNHWAGQCQLGDAPQFTMGRGYQHNWRMYAMKWAVDTSSKERLGQPWMHPHIISIFHVRLGKNSDSPGQVEAESERPEKEL